MVHEPRVAIVGAGPSGLFAAQALLQRDERVHVDLYDRLPTPFGLLRYGVAPDHQDLRPVQDRLATIFDETRVRFVGHVEFGTDLDRADLLASYDAVIYAVGAPQERRVGVPGEDLEGSRSAGEVVSWYAGHPDAEVQSLAGVRAAVTIGVGNVGVDVARILARPADQLSATDMPDAVLDELRDARIDEVWVVGRRGPQHASFTVMELRELLTLPGVQPVIHPSAFEGLDESTLDRQGRVKLKELREAADAVVPDAHARLHLLFWHRPVRIEGDGRVQRLVLERTRIDEFGQVTSAGEERSIDCELVLRAVGYRGNPLPGVPFDEDRGIIPNRDGRVTDDSGEVQPGEYVVGWSKRGAVGLIGSNKSDARGTVAAVLEDLAELPRRDLVDPETVWERCGLRPTSFEDWERIEAAEQARGTSQGRERVKIATWQDLLGIAGGERAHPDRPTHRPG